jgi:hypothetical protein
MSLLAAALALLIEAAETLADHIRLEWPDVKDDCTGIAIALAITLLMRVRTGTANPVTSEK